MIGWSARQREALAAIESGAAVVFVPGPVQSGKSLIADYGFFTWAAENWSGYDFILASSSERQLESVVLRNAAEFAAEAGLEWGRHAEHYEMGSAYGEAPNRFWPLLGAVKNSDLRARSYTVAGARLDEATVMVPEFVDAVLDRCSVPGAVAVMTTNPGGPAHFLKGRYVDGADGERIVHVPFQLSDNPMLTDAYVDGLKGRYRGAMLQRMVYGEWAAAEGLIYAGLEEAIGDPPRLTTDVRLRIAADYASSSVTHALLLGEWPDGTTWAIREWRHDGRQRGALTNEEQAAAIGRHLVQGRPIEVVVVDPSATAFRVTLSKLLRLHAKAADSDVLNGIQLVNERIDGGTLRISRNGCPELISELRQYRWDERAGVFGEDRPIKENDHGCDALRYGVYTLGGRQRPRPRIVRAHGRRRMVA